MKVSEAFKDRCVHCDHYKEDLPCCFCGAHKLDTNLKTREQHLEELGEDELDI